MVALRWGYISTRRRTYLMVSPWCLHLVIANPRPNRHSMSTAKEMIPKKEDEELEVDGVEPKELDCDKRNYLLMLVLVENHLCFGADQMRSVCSRGRFCIQDAQTYRLLAKCQPGLLLFMK